MRMKIIVIYNLVREEEKHVQQTQFILLTFLLISLIAILTGCGSENVAKITLKILRRRRLHNRPNLKLPKTVVRLIFILLVIMMLIRNYTICLQRKRVLR